VRQLRLSLIDISAEISDLSHGREVHLRIGLAPDSEYFLKGADAC